MQRFSRLVVRFRVPVIVATLVVSVVFASLLQRLEVDADILNYLPDSDPAVRLFDAVGVQFAGNSLAIIGIEGKDVFTAQTIRTIHQLTEGIREIPEVTHVTSLTDVLDIRTDEWGLEVGRLIDKFRLPTDPDELARLRSYTLEKDLYAGRIVSEDGTVALVIARLREGESRTAVAFKIAEVVAEIDPLETIYYAGTPFQMRDIQKMIVRDLRYLIPLVSVVLVLVLAVSFRSFMGVVLPLITVLLSTVWALGVMALAHVPMTLISNITPIVLIAVGSAYGIHFVSRFFEEPLAGDEGPLRAQRALIGVGFPILLAGLTTLGSFLSFTGSYLTIIKYFGVFTGAGVFFATILSITFLPAVLSFKQTGAQPDDTPSEQLSPDFVTRTMDRLGSFVLRRSRWILGAALAVVVISVAGLPRLSREVDMIKYFPRRSDIRIAETLMEEKFGGSIPLQVSIHGDLRDPLVLKEMWKLEKYLETIPAVYKPQSISNLIAEMNYVMNGRYTLPDTREEVSNLWFFLEGEETLEQLVDSDRSWGLIQANMASVNTASIRRIVDQVDGYLATNVDTTLIAVDLAELMPEALTSARWTQRDRIASLVRDDVIGRHARFDPSVEQVSEVLVSHQQDSFALSTDEGLALQERIVAFYSQDLAQATVASVSEVAVALCTQSDNTTPQVAEIAAILHDHLDSNRSTDYLHAVADDSDALQALIREARGDFLADRALEDVLALLPEGYRDDAALMKRLRGDLWELNHRNVLLPAPPSITGAGPTDPVPLAVEQTGIPLIYAHLDENLVTTQVVSLGFTAALVFIILAIQFGSLVAGVIGVVPLALTVLINFGVMSYLGVAIDTATVLVGAIAIGIGIDYTIHFLWRFRSEAQAHDQPLLVLDATLETTGRAIMVNAATVALGFLVLLLASVVPIRNFGWLTALTMVSSALAALCVLPALILVLRPRFVGDLLQNNHGAKSDLPDSHEYEED